jgi:hypothetical protein
MKMEGPTLTDSPKNYIKSGFQSRNMVAVGDNQGLINYVMAHAPSYGLDPIALLSVAAHEGAFSAFGSNGIGDSGNSYGPWQLNVGPNPQYAAFLGIPQNSHLSSQAALARAWSDDGINYVMSYLSNRSIGVGVTGSTAIDQIVSMFEISNNIPGEIQDSITSYVHIKSTGEYQGFSFTGGAPPPSDSGQFPAGGAGGGGGGNSGGRSQPSGGGFGGDVVRGFADNFSGPVVLTVGLAFVVLGFLMWKGADTVKVVNQGISTAKVPARAMAVMP